MKRAFWSTCAAVLLSTGNVAASDPVGIYAIIDKVVLEPNSETPERVRIWGTFAVATRKRDYKPVERGFMYFSLAKDHARECRTEWADLKKAAGTGQIIALGSRYQSGEDGENYRVRRSKIRSNQAGAVDKERIQKLIENLDDNAFSVREKASKELKELGEAAEPALRTALKAETKPEARRRLEALLDKETPDLYPVGFGLTKVRRDTTYQPIKELLLLPAPLSPIESDQPEAGQVTLTVRNVLDPSHAGARYVFEIEGASGSKETSAKVTAGDKKTSWSPALKLKPGEKYTWRVWATDGAWKSPVASAAFKAKAAR